VEPLAFEPQWLISPPLHLYTFHLVSFSKLQNSMTTYMDPVLFKAAEEGNIDPFENDQTRLNQLLRRTPFFMST